jgi:hypothetical protein
MNPADKTETTLELEISRHGEALRIAMTRKTLEDKETLRSYEERTYAAGRVAAKCADIVRMLNNANIRGSLAGENYVQLRQSGFFLFEELLPLPVQHELNESSAEYLIINIDDGLVHIPWELLYTGSDFLCRKFSMGRVVRTRQSFSRPQPRTLATPLSMLIICDPSGDLDKACEEGDLIRGELDRLPLAITADLFNYGIDSASFKEYLRGYDIIHYAGHADYTPDNPGESGWLLCGSKFTATDIRQLSPHLPFPALVFANACQSGQTAEWRLDEGFEDRIFGMANAFLLSGVQHYIGTFWEVLDESSCEFSVAFYRHLIRGEAVGSALKKAREHLVETFGEETIVWASYMLYGNPAAHYLAPQEAGLQQISSLQGKTATVSGAFPSGQVRAIPGDRRFFSFVSLALVALIISLAVIFLLIRERVPLFTSAQKEVTASALVAEKKTPEELRAVLARLSDKYAQQQKLRADLPPADPWTSHTLTVSLLGVSCIGDCSREKETEAYVLSLLSRGLGKSGRVSLVEREKLSSLLDELQLSTSDIADQERAPVMLGKLLGAHLIVAGKIVRIPGDNSLTLRVFETDTSRIVISIAEPWNDANRAEAINRAEQALLREIRTLYPLKGKIARLKPEEILLNIGARVGVTPDSVFSVIAEGAAVSMEGKTLGHDQKKIGTIKIAAVEDNFSRGTILKQEAPFKEGAQVVEVLNQ